jgi:hypothetical protein
VLAVADTAEVVDWEGVVALILPPRNSSQIPIR